MSASAAAGEEMHSFVVPGSCRGSRGPRRARSRLTSAGFLSLALQPCRPARDRLPRARQVPAPQAARQGRVRHRRGVQEHADGLEGGHEEDHAHVRLAHGRQAHAARAAPVPLAGQAPQYHFAQGHHRRRRGGHGVRRHGALRHGPAQDHPVAAAAGRRAPQALPVPAAARAQVRALVPNHPQGPQTCKFGAWGGVWLRKGGRPWARGPPARPRRPRLTASFFSPFSSSRKTATCASATLASRAKCPRARRSRTTAASAASPWP